MSWVAATFAANPLKGEFLGKIDPHTFLNVFSQAFKNVQTPHSPKEALYSIFDLSFYSTMAP